MKISLRSIFSAAAILLCCNSAHASITIFNTLDAADGVSFDFSNGDLIAQQFVTDDSAYSFESVSFSINLGIADATEVRVRLWENDSATNLPNFAKERELTGDAPTTTTWEFAPSRPMVLSASSKYWISMQVFTSSTSLI